MKLEEYLRKMGDDWNERARQNARHFIVNNKTDWDEDDFFASGVSTVAHDILTDMANVCQGKDPKQMRVLELGCGAGRVTRALANVFGEVHGVDVSDEMLRQAKQALSGTPNAFVHQGDGATLAVLGDRTFDFAYSCCVFQHIASYEVIRSYVREVAQRLPPGALFKFEVQGCTKVKSDPSETWLGVPFSLGQATEMADACGFELRHYAGIEDECFWLWYFKRP
jgi:SAM-dependent methyltransferase